MHLSDVLPGLSMQGRTAKSGKLFELTLGLLARILFSTDREIAVVFRLYIAALILFYVTASNNPTASKRRQTLANIATDSRIIPGPAVIVNSNWRVLLDRAIKVSGDVLTNLAKRNAYTILRALDIDFFRVGKFYFVAEFLGLCG